MQNSTPPVFLNLLQIRLPVAAVLSITHRLSGVILVLAIPCVFYLFSVSLEGADSYFEVMSLLETPLARLSMFLFIWSLLHHLLSGIRYLFIDIEVGVDKPGYRMTAWAVLISAPLLSLSVCWGMA